MLSASLRLLTEAADALKQRQAVAVFGIVQHPEVELQMLGDVQADRRLLTDRVRLIFSQLLGLPQRLDDAC